MRKKLVAGNWKMNKNHPEGISLVKEIMAGSESLQKENACWEAVFCPPYFLVQACADLVKDSAHFSAGAQNCHPADQGAFTGEISARMIADMGASNVIIGHSERRQYFHEDDVFLLEKLNAALRCGLKPIFCCGETLMEREAGTQLSVVEQQLAATVFRLDPAAFQSCVIAYEPVWAIGTGLTASTEQAQEMHAYIRKLIEGRFGSEVAGQSLILYGGSCNASNAASLFSCPDVDGGLIGGASLKAADFISIIAAAAAHPGGCQ